MINGVVKSESLMINEVNKLSFEEKNSMLKINSTSVNISGSLYATTLYENNVALSSKYIQMTNGVAGLLNISNLNSSNIYNSNLIETSNLLVSTTASANTFIENGEIDMATFGRSYIANPDLVHRLRNGWPLAQPDYKTIYNGGKDGYIYPKF